MPSWRSIVPRGLRNWLRNPRASVRWLGSTRAFRRGRAATLDLSASAGVPLILRCHPAAGRTFRLFLDDSDHRRELRAFVAALPSGQLRLFDLGAHYGFFTLAAIALGGTDTRILAVEPSPAAQRVLNANLALAAAGGARARVLGAAVGATDGSMRMLAGGVASEHYMFAAPSARPDAVAIRQCNLPTLARQAGFAPTLVKLDVEGGEFEVLTAPPNLEALRAWRVPLLLELHAEWIRQRGRNPAEVLAALAGLGYELFHDGAPVAAAHAVAVPLVRLLCRFPRPHTA